jgi:hypothetical protein
MSDTASVISESEAVESLPVEEEGEETRLLEQDPADAVNDIEADQGATSNDGTVPRKRIDKPEAARDPGRSLLPASRVLKIIKADEVRSYITCDALAPTYLRTCAWCRRRLRS